MKSYVSQIVAITLLVAIGLPANAAEVVTDSNAASCAGRVCAVEGLVVTVYTSRNNNTFLNFGNRYPNQTFNAVIFSNAAAQFPNVYSYEGRRARVTGLVKMYKGRPEIILNEPSQLGPAN